MSSAPLTIRVSSGTGTGPTSLAAFDAALLASGVANFNLLRLSSVIPTNSRVEIVEDAEPFPGGWGDKLYVVYAEQRAVVPGEEAWAGVGWVHDEVTGSGLFVEHEGTSESAVRSDILESIRALQVGRKMEVKEPQVVMTSAQCTDLPVCALVVAVFESEPWRRV